MKRRCYSPTASELESPTGTNSSVWNWIQPLCWLNLVSRMNCHCHNKRLAQAGYLDCSPPRQIYTPRDHRNLMSWGSRNQHLDILALLGPMGSLCGTLGLRVSHQFSSPKQQQPTLLEYTEEEDIELDPSGRDQRAFCRPCLVKLSPRPLLMTTRNTKNSCRGELHVHLRRPMICSIISSTFCTSLFPIEWLCQ